VVVVVGVGGGGGGTQTAPSPPPVQPLGDLLGPGPLDELDTRMVVNALKVGRRDRDRGSERWEKGGGEGVRGGRCRDRATGTR
jgi:hypothetical protein